VTVVLKIILSAEISFDPDAKKIHFGNTPIKLTTTESKILKYLIKNQDRIVTIEEIKNFILNNKSISKNVVYTHLLNLRRKAPFLSGALEKIPGKGILWNSQKLTL